MSERIATKRHHAQQKRDVEAPQRPLKEPEMPCFEKRAFVRAKCRSTGIVEQHRVGGSQGEPLMLADEDPGSEHDS